MNQTPDPASPADESSRFHSIASIDTVRLLRSSVRCLLFGLIGLVPILGAGLAWQAMTMGRELLEETGEAWDWEPFLLLWVTGSMCVALLAPFLGLGMILLLWAWMTAGHSCLFARRFREGAPPLFNGARREAFAGMALGMAGVGGSVMLVALLFSRLAFPDW
jgi:hypothetical protein